jgi:hypothetical protein
MTGMIKLAKITIEVWGPKDWTETKMGEVLELSDFETLEMKLHSAAENYVSERVSSEDFAQMKLLLG